MIVLLVSQPVFLVQPAGLSQALRLAVPLDTKSASVWSAAIEGAPTVGMIILNPSNGPGTSADSAYQTLSSRAQSRGIAVLGYVYTRWASGNVSVKQAEGWIDDYYSWYHVDGIMLDEANDTCGSNPVNYYQSLYNYVKAEHRPGVVMLNPGTSSGSCYAGLSDVLLDFENSYQSYLLDYRQENWTSGYAPSHFFQIVFDAQSVPEMQTAVTVAIARGAGWVFVTDLDNSNGNPYSALPSYYGRELDYVSRIDSPRDGPQNLLPAVFAVAAGLTASVPLLVILGRRKKVSD